ncbi:hypothetical protein Bbelb_011210 [Branchiostoma belcheri]|nr:hypothetical protein Bbelb_011210 [Branchiostoma belcheri]
MATDLKFLSLNVNGMKDRCKRAQALDFCRTNGADVACLQGCHDSTVADKKQWSRQWGQTCVWSMGTNSARGVGILLSPRWSLRASKVDDGRVASVLVSDGLSTYNIVNVYAPCSAGERQTFFATIHQYMYTTLVLADDFNCVLDPTRDRSSASATTAGTQDVRELRSLIDDLEVIDACRVEHPSESEYTWRSPSNSTRSRLDKIYVPDGPDFTSAIVPCTFSDNDAVAIFTKPPVTLRKGICKCNTTVLSDCSARWLIPQMSHFSGLEGAMQAALSQYGKFISVKYPTYPPPFDNIQNGVRQYRIELSRPIPYGLRVGNNIVYSGTWGKSNLVTSAANKVTCSPNVLKKVATPGNTWSAAGVVVPDTEEKVDGSEIDDNEN